MKMKSIIMLQNNQKGMKDISGVYVLSIEIVFKATTVVVDTTLTEIQLRNKHMIEKKAKELNELERFFNIPEYKYLSKLIRSYT